MAQRKRTNPTPQEPGSVAVLALVFGVLIVLALLVRLVIGALSAPAPAPKETEPPEPIATESAPEETQEKQSFWDKLFGGKKEEPETQPSEPQETQPSVVSTATVASMGDMLMHIQLFDEKHDAIANLGNGNYDFSPIFEYLTDTGSGVAFPDLEGVDGVSPPR